jgi:hypothetical protein
MNTAVLLLTLKILTVNTITNEKGIHSAEDRITITTGTIHYETMQACRNGREELALAYGSYGMAKLPTEIVSAVCIDRTMGSVQ